MRILQIAPLWESVPPVGYGGTEAVVHLLTEELVRRGHDVMLWASGDSRTSAELRSCLPYSLRTAKGIREKQVYAWEHAARSLEGAGEFDVVHNHAGEDVMSLARLAPRAPMLTTMHCNMSPDRRFVWDGYAGFYNTISWSQMRAMPDLDAPRCAGVAYNGIDVESFPYDDQKDGYLLFLARISQEKGTHIAIEVAQRLGRRLLIAGKVDPADYEYFLSSVAPRVDGEKIVFLGEADGTLKRQLYRKAQALLMPIVWDEPFGLVMAEAQACGTPVIAFNRGAAPEIVKHGETGFVVENVEQMTEAVPFIGEIDSRRCRTRVEELFSAEAMTERYERMYTDIASEVTPAARFSGARVIETAAPISFSGTP